MKKGFFVSFLLFSFSGWSQTLSVGTLNLFHYPASYDVRLQNMKTEIKRGVPQIMGFQEAAIWPGRKSLFTDYVGLTSSYSYHQVTNDFRVMQEGVGIASKFPAKEYFSIELPETSRMSRQYAQLALFQTPVGPVWVANIHASPGPAKAEARLAQFRAVQKEIDRVRGKDPVLFVGDFNADPEAEAMKYLFKLGWKDVLDGKGWTYDHLTNPFCLYPYQEHIDYILYRPQELELVKAEMSFVDSIVSDHYGVSAEFKKP